MQVCVYTQFKSNNSLFLKIGFLNMMLLLHLFLSTAEY